MARYKTMYCILCKSISDVLDKLPDSSENVQGKWILQKGLLDAEEQYILTADCEDSEHNA